VRPDISCGSQRGAAAAARGPAARPVFAATLLNCKESYLTLCPAAPYDEIYSCSLVGSYLSPGESDIGGRAGCEGPGTLRW
jgi:hypothetical protein